MDRKRRIRWIKDLSALGLFILTTFAARASLADHYIVPSGSMKPTVQIGDRILVNKLAYGLRVPFTTHYLIEGSDPQSGDVVILKSPEDGTILLKRVVGVPGDPVTMNDGRSFNLADDEYFVMGDNRGNSHDARAFGPVRRGAIFGHAKGVFRRDGHFVWRKL